MHDARFEVGVSREVIGVDRDEDDLVDGLVEALVEELLGVGGFGPADGVVLGHGVLGEASCQDTAEHDERGEPQAEHEPSSAVTPCTQPAERRPWWLADHRCVPSVPEHTSARPLI